MKLRDYLKLNSVNQTQFCKIHDIPIQTLSRVINGAPVQLHTAAKIVLATQGTVSFLDLLTVKEQCDMDERKRKMDNLNAQLA